MKKKLKKYTVFVKTVENHEVEIESTSKKKALSDFYKMTNIHGQVIEELVMEANDE